ncbi:plasma-membrane proton-efflux P-type ATPase [Thecamonas trahens ATCC 50062]|uniref:Proton pump n=1 Tax=Thecamonas trahens ATCC 50062 TaxID=461836 RepID=A0A0L0D921_THETB|nr:plasma-membrane proton-efflux P-type ATPase [Thecamonas trahens ATCC 50062]KNC47793.1 plasma-membrane proton-efflux P-type ATPase [Thecamonas trahens ATCC 50062]|eukprot:XP_013759271.1 plasma-membrane proton-efflux P-type ATPase [Thecamonas trahens ATCC 50062]
MAYTYSGYDSYDYSSSGMDDVGEKVNEPPDVLAAGKRNKAGGKAGSGVMLMEQLAAEVTDDEPAVTSAEPMDAGIAETSLQTGLSPAQVASLRMTHGYNEVVTKPTPAWLQFALFFWGPMPWLIEIAAVLSIVVGDWKGLGIIVTLLVINAVIGFHEERHAGAAVAALQDSLAPDATVLRDGKVRVIPARELVPGDVIMVKGGDIVPADAIVVPLKPVGMTAATASRVMVDQASLTGESLPVSRSYGQRLLSSSLVKTGDVTAQVTAIGAETVIGKASSLVSEASSSAPKGIKKTLVKLSNVMLVMAFVVALVLLVHGLVLHRDLLELLQLVLVIVIAAIPVAMPTVVTVTMAVGAHQLARANAVVTELTSLEQLASVDILCSDKTGTLTQNKLSLHDCVVPTKAITIDDVLDAALFCSVNDDDAVDHVFLQAGRARAAGEPWINVSRTEQLHRTESIRVPVTNSEVLLRQARAASVTIDTGSAGTQHPVAAGVRILHRVPFDPAVKRTEATIVDSRFGEPSVYRVAKGATHVIATMCGLDDDVNYSASVEHMANRGYRSVAVARSVSSSPDDPDAQWELVGLFAIFDPPRIDTAHVVRRCHELGIEVKMLTGDQSIIGRETARLIGLGDNIVTADELFSDSLTDAIKAERAEALDGLGEVYPSHKYAFVSLLQSRGHVVAMTGDGVNDAPAIKAANCGIAVEGATAAAQSAAAVVLLNPGLSAIINAVEEARRIFTRMSSYITFRIVDSFHVLFFLAISILFLDFELDSIHVAILAILNDVSLVSIAFDHARDSARPLKWNLPFLLILGGVLSCVMIASTIVTYYIAHKASWGWQLQVDATKTAVYLQISVSGHLAIFATRVQDSLAVLYAPSRVVVGGVLASQLVATALAGFGILMEKLAWSHVAEIWGIAVATFLIVDYVKLVFHIFFTDDDETSVAAPARAPDNAAPPAGSVATVAAQAKDH